MQKALRPVGIVGVGSYLPEQILTNKDMTELVDTSEDWIQSRTGIIQRRKAAEGEATSDLGTKAARQALDNAGLSPDDVDLIIAATITPDMAFPATACIIQDNLQARKAAAFDLAAACSGFLYALAVGQQFIATGQYDTVLIVAAETMSSILNWEDRNTCVIFGDGAGAVILQSVQEGEGFLSFELGAEGAGGNLLLVPAGGSRRPASLETVQNKEHFLQMNGNEVYKFAVKIMVEAAAKALENAGLTIDETDYLIPHQANTRIIDCAVKKLKISPEKVIINLDRYGNMSSASIPVALAETYQKGLLNKGDNIVMVGFGAGLTWGSCVLKWSI